MFIFLKNMNNANLSSGECPNSDNSSSLPSPTFKTALSLAKERQEIQDLLASIGDCQAQKVAPITYLKALSSQLRQPTAQDLLQAEKMEELLDEYSERQHHLLLVFFEKVAKHLDLKEPSGWTSMRRLEQDFEASKWLNEPSSDFDDEDTVPCTVLKRKNQ